MLHRSRRLTGERHGSLTQPPLRRQAIASRAIRRREEPRGASLWEVVRGVILTAMSDSPNLAALSDEELRDRIWVATKRWFDDTDASAELRALRDERRRRRQGRGGPAGVREPRRPAPLGGTGAMQLPRTDPKP